MKKSTKAQIKKIENLVKRDISKSKWKHKKSQWEHIASVRKYALQLAGKLKSHDRLITITHRCNITT